MGLLEQVIGSVVSGALRGGGRTAPAGGGGMGGIGGALSNPIVKALLMLLLAKAASGGLGNLGSIFGGGGGHAPAPAPRPMPHPRDPDSEGGPSPYGRGPAPGGDDDGDLGGFAQGGGYGRGDDDGSGGGYGRRGGGGGEYGDLSGMLDGPGDQAPPSSGGGGYGRGQGGSPLGGGLDGLVDSFQRSGLGDVIGSWIGHGGNQPIAPNRLADALGSDTVNTLSQQTGLNRDDLLQQLAQALPEVVNQLTPHGRPPSEAEQRNWL